VAELVVAMVEAAMVEVDKVVAATAGVDLVEVMAEEAKAEAPEAAMEVVATAAGAVVAAGAGEEHWREAMAVEALKVAGKAVVGCRSTKL